jgi:hypothetical protein
MTNNSIDPYAPPKPLEPLQGERKRFRIRRIDSLIPSVLWWCYFAVCFADFAYSAAGLIALSFNYRWDMLISPLGFKILLQAVGLVGIFAYLRKVPFFNPFFWGLVFLLRLGLTLYVPAMLAYRLALNEEFVITRDVIIIFIPMFLPLPEAYALWRYSSSSSPIWEAPRVQWRRLGRRFVEVIQHLRRA